MSVDELTSMDGNKCILQLRGLRPFLSRKYDLKKHPNYKDAAESDKRNAFNPASLVNTKLAVKPGDIFTVYNTSLPELASGSDDDVLNYDDVDDPEAYA